MGQTVSAGQFVHTRTFRGKFLVHKTVDQLGPCTAVKLLEKSPGCCTVLASALDLLVSLALSIIFEALTHIHPMTHLSVCTCTTEATVAHQYCLEALLHQYNTGARCDSNP